MTAAVDPDQLEAATQRFNEARKAKGLPVEFAEHELLMVAAVMASAAKRRRRNAARDPRATPAGEMSEYEDSCIDLGGAAVVRSAS